MDTNDLQKQISGLDDQGLSAIEQAIRETRQKKAPSVDIESINASMSPADRDKVRAEINRILAGR